MCVLHVGFLCIVPAFVASFDAPFLCGVTKYGCAVPFPVWFWKRAFGFSFLSSLPNSCALHNATGTHERLVLVTQGLINGCMRMGAMKGQTACSFSRMGRGLFGAQEKKQRVGGGRGSLSPPFVADGRLLTCVTPGGILVRSAVLCVCLNLWGCNLVCTYLGVSPTEQNRTCT